MNINKKVIGSIALVLAPALVDAATIQRVALSGQLGEEGLSANDAYDNATFSGWFDIDLDAMQVTPFGSDSLYEMINWDVSIAAPGATTLFNRSSGEALDDGSLLLDRSTDQVNILIREDIGTSRSLSLVFGTSFNISFLTTFPELVNGDPALGSASDLIVGSLQFGTSSFPTSVSTASFAVTEVPVPAAAWLFGSALLGLAGVSRRKKA